MRGEWGVQDTWLMAPEKENPRAHMAMSALARALHKTKKACIIRFVPRANQAVFVGCATPLQGDKDKPDCLVLNYLPFTGIMLNSLTRSATMLMFLSFTNMIANGGPWLLFIILCYFMTCLCIGVAA